MTPDPSWLRLSDQHHYRKEQKVQRLCRRGFIIFALKGNQYKLSYAEFLRIHNTQHNDFHYNDTQHNDSRLNEVHHNDIQHNDIQHYDSQYNDIQH